MKEIIDDNTAIIKDDTHLVQLYYRDEDGLCRILTPWLFWTLHQDGSRSLTLWEIREVLRMHFPGHPLYLLYETPNQGELLCTGLVPGERRWRRWGVTAGYEA